MKSTDKQKYKKHQYSAYDHSRPYFDEARNSWMYFRRVVFMVLRSGIREASYGFHHWNPDLHYNSNNYEKETYS